MDSNRRGFFRRLGAAFLGFGAFFLSARKAFAPSGPPSIGVPMANSTVTLPLSCYGTDAALIQQSGCKLGTGTGTIVSDNPPNWQVNFSSGSTGSGVTLTI